MEITIGENIRRLRIERRMTQEQLAERLCVSRQTLAKWENGELKSEEAINMLKDFTEVEFDEVVAFTQGKIELITVEENAKQSFVTAENYYNQEKYYEALQEFFLLYQEVDIQILQTYLNLESAEVQKIAW